MSLIKVAIIEPVGGHGGMDYYDFGMCRGVTRAGIDVALFTCDETKTPENAGFTVSHIYKGIYGKAPAWSRGLRYLRGTITALVSAVREGRRICHFHFFHIGLLQAFNVLLARLLRRRVVITAHDVESFVESIEVPILNRWVYRRAHSVVVHNKTSQQELIDRIGLPLDKITIIPHGNYLHMVGTLPTKTESCKVLGIPAGAMTILFFGQIKEVKGLDLLLEALPIVLKANPDLRLVIAGRPWKKDFSKYETQMERLGIRDHCITHIRFIPDEQVPLYYAAADVVALPYRRIYQSGVLLMAMSYGRAVLASDLPGMAELIEDGRNGFLFRQGDAGDLAARLNAILADDALRQRVAERGYEHVRDHHDWQEIGKSTAAVYAELL